MKGGKRIGAGRPCVFRESETITIRIPKGSKEIVKEFIVKLRKDERFI